MKRFFSEFQILQAPPAELGMGREQLQPASRTSRILQAPPADCHESIFIDFRKHYHLGWTHYRILTGQNDVRKRAFYFEQSATQRWSTRELERKIEGALFERVALSRDARKLISLEKKKGPPEVVRYEDIFKDPYLLDFLGLKGAYSEKDLEAAKKGGSPPSSTRKLPPRSTR